MPVVVPISEPSTTNSSVDIVVGQLLQISITSQCKLCCTNPGLFSPILPNGELLNAGFSASYSANAVGTAEVTTVAANGNCGEIRGIPTRSVHISAGVDRKKPE